MVAPWVWQLLNELTDERRKRIRSEERARLAAHLHDSVLQTLAMIQRTPDDPGRMVALARRQERELRQWLYGDEPTITGGFRQRIQAAAAEVEEMLEVQIEVVAVGDCEVDEKVEALLAAMREAMVNAATHSGAAQVDVYAEVQDDRIEAYVRDKGRGFDLAAVPTDRRGVADSIEGRMSRVGGRATVHTAPDEGTEVELVVRR